MTNNDHTPQASESEGMTIADAKEHLQYRYEATQGTEAEHAASEQHDIDDLPKRGNSEAAKYRRQLRDVEAERDQIASELNQARQMILGRHLNEHTIRGEDGEMLQLHPKALEELTLTADLFDGLDLNSEAVADFFTQLYTERPYIFHASTQREGIKSLQPQVRLRGGSNPYDDPEPAGEKFKSAFKPSRR